MNQYWIMLLIAAGLEIIWAVGLKYTEGFTRLWPSVGTVLAMAASMYLWARAATGLPIGTAYAVWTGIGAVGTAIVGMFLLKRPWRSARLARWAGRPLVHGVWFGRLTSDFVDGTGKARSEIPVAFVIRQTCLGYSIVSHTKLQDSETLVESLEVDHKTDIVRLRYIYEFLVMQNGERKLTMGAAELKVLDGGTRLRGHYVTNSPTRGAADLQLVQRKVRGVDTFEAAQKIYEKRFATSFTLGSSAAT